MESAGTGAVVEPLLTLEREDLTGVLEFVAQGVTTRIFVRAGEIAFADQGTIGETLGRTLLRCGRLGEEHVAGILRHMTDSLVAGRHVRFGEILVEYGFMTADELEMALTEQVKAKLIGCVHRGTGAWSFTNNDSRIDEVGSYVLRTRPMLVDAAALLAERRLETVLVLNQNRFPEIVAPESILIEEFELSRAEAAVLRDLDGTSSFQFLFSSKPALAQAAPVIAALVLGHGVELRTTPAGVRQSSEARLVPKEFQTARRGRLDDDKATPREGGPAPANGATKHLTPSSPDSPGRGLPSIGRPSFSSVTVTAAQAVTLRRSSRTGLEPPTTEVHARTRDAFERLKSALDAHRPLNKKRRWPDPATDLERRLMAESAFYSGRMHLRAEETERALPGLHRALELRPREREYELYVKWAQMLVNDEFKDDARRTEVKTLAARLVREESRCALAFAILGHCMMHDGKDEAGLRFFQRANALDAKVVDSASLAHLLGARLAPESGRTLAKVDISTRKNIRGQLPTPIDELVPASKTSDSGDEHRPSVEGTTGARSSRQNIRSAEPRHRTPHGGLRAVSAPTPESELERTPQGPPITETPHPPAPPPIFQPTPTAPLFSPVPLASPIPAATARARPSGPPLTLPVDMPSGPRPPPLPERGARQVSGPPAPIAPPKAPPPARPTGDEGDGRSAPPPSQGSPPGVARPRPVEPPPPRTQTQTQSMALPPAAPPRPSEGDPSRSAAGQAQHRPHDRATTKATPARAITIALAGSFAVAAAIVVWVGTRQTAIGTTPSSVTSTSVQTTEPSEVPAAPTESTPPTPVPVPEPTTPPSSAAKPTEPTADTSAVKPTASTTTKDGHPAGTLRAPKAVGRRIYFDGRIVGEGGVHDLTVPCGTHRVKVGSTGTEHPVTIPCGGVVEVN